MISQDLHGLANDFAQFRGDTVEMTPEAIGAIVLALRALAEQAENLERTVVPFPARMTTQPPWGWGGNVVPLRQPAHSDGAAS